MSLGIVIKGPEGLVLAAESRVTLTAEAPNRPPISVNFDNVTKVLALAKHNYVGVVTYGQAVIGLRTAQSFIPELEAELSDDRMPIEDFARAFGAFFLKQWDEALPAQAKPWRGPNMVFMVAGYDEGAPYGRLFEIQIPNQPDPVEQHPGADAFGISWGGQREIVDRLIQGYDSNLTGIVQKALNLNHAQQRKLAGALNQLGLGIPILAMPLQDLVDLAIFMIRTTITGQSLMVGLRGCGGPIDVATITRERMTFVQQKRIQGEQFFNLNNGRF